MKRGGKRAKNIRETKRNMGEQRKEKGEKQKQNKNIE
jgi:hypothetical protein